jgi:hypothetical protein
MSGCRIFNLVSTQSQLIIIMVYIGDLSVALENDWGQSSSSGPFVPTILFRTAAFIHGGIFSWLGVSFVYIYLACIIFITDIMWQALHLHLFNLYPVAINRFQSEEAINSRFFNSNNFSIFTFYNLTIQIEESKWFGCYIFKKPLLLNVKKIQIFCYQRNKNIPCCFLALYIMQISWYDQFSNFELLYLIKLPVKYNNNQ